MDDLIQANLELHAELGKEVRINLENEAKINRLEKQQVRYEEDIQYLYGIIEKLEVRSDYSKKEKDSLTLRISELQSQLRNSEETCNEKEKFILFQESQLSELEKTIYQLKQPASTSHNKMSRTRTDLASLDTMTNAQRLEEIQANVERLYLYTVRSERLPDVGTAERLRERINRAIVLIHNTLVSQIDQTNNNLTECKNEKLIRESEQVRRNLEMANRAIGERDVLINQYRNRLNNLQDERDVLVDRLDIAWARFMTERLETRSLRRQRLVLRIANRQ